MGNGGEGSRPDALSSPSQRAGEGVLDGGGGRRFAVGRSDGREWGVAASKEAESVTEAVAATDAATTASLAAMKSVAAAASMA